MAFGLAVVLGSFAALRTTHAAAPPTVSSAEIARQNHALDHAEATLRAELRRKPSTTAAQPGAVIYRRPPAIVHVIHRHGGEAEGNERGEGLDD